MSIVLKLTAKKGKPVLRGFARYWTVMMDFSLAGKSFTFADIEGQCNAPRGDIRDFWQRLAKAGFITSVPGTDRKRWNVAIRQSATPKVRRDGTVLKGSSGQQAMWNTMRSPVSRNGFTARDIVAWGSTDELKIARETARSYILTLANAGYLIQLAAGGPNRLAIWRLAPHMNTGPLPPMILRTKAVFDQNRHEVFGEAVAEEERV